MSAQELAGLLRQALLALGVLFIFVDAGDSLGVYFSRTTSSGSGNAEFTVKGYYVDLPFPQ